MKILLLLYFALFFGLAILLPTYRVWKATGVNPYRLGSTESARDYIGFLFRLTMLTTAFVVMTYTFLPEVYEYLVPIAYLVHPTLVMIGAILLAIAFVWMLVAQVHMQRSWRIGIDEDVKTKLVQTGLFKCSRNPIFLGMRVMLFGSFSRPAQRRLSRHPHRGRSASSNLSPPRIWRSRLANHKTACAFARPHGDSGSIEVAHTHHPLEISG